MYTQASYKHSKRAELMRGVLQSSRTWNAKETLRPLHRRRRVIFYFFKSQWNPNPDHHVLAVGAGKSVILIATGTGGTDATAITEALLQAASSGPKAKAAAPKNGKDAVEQQEDSDQSESEDEGEEDDDDMAGTGKKAPPVKWEALVSGVRGKGRRRAAAAVDGVEGEVGPRVVLR